MKKTSLIILFVMIYHNLYPQIRGFYDGNTYYEEEINRDAPTKKSTNLGFHFGVSNYLGDLGGNSGARRTFVYDNNFKKNTFFYGFALTHYRREAIGIRLDYTWGKIAGSDQDVEFKKTTDNAYYRYKRNLNFQTKISEGSLLAEFYPLKLIRYKNKVHHWSVQPYVLLGLGIFKFNPQGSYFDEIADDYVWVDLAPLRTEGQGMKEYSTRKPYKLTQMNIPFGLGIRYVLNSKTSIGFEFVGRKLSTDYLDDVSTNFIDPALFSNYLNEEDAALAKILHNKSNVIDPDNPYPAGSKRGNPTQKDFYYSFNLSLSIRINRIPKKVTTSDSKKKMYKYDNDEICN